MLKPIQSQSIVNEVTEQLKKLILDGNMKPGDKFPSENDLCSLFRCGFGQLLKLLISLIRFGQRA